MSKSPASLSPTGVVALDLEILGEEAAALGRAGRRVEETLADLAVATPAMRETALREAAEAVQHYFILRETRGFRRHDDAIAEYGIPRAVIARLGAS